MLFDCPKLNKRYCRKIVSRRAPPKNLLQFCVEMKFIRQQTLKQSPGEYFKNDKSKNLERYKNYSDRFYKILSPSFTYNKSVDLG